MHHIACVWSYFLLFGIIWKKMHKVHLAGAYMCDVRIFSPCLCGIIRVLHPTVQTHAVSGVSLTGFLVCERECEWLSRSLCVTYPGCTLPLSLSLLG